MENKYLFRGKAKKTREWLIGGICERDDRCFIIETTIYEIDNSKSWGMFEVDPETVGRFTVMHDLHNTMVFENDIIEFVNCASPRRYLIWWVRECSMITAVPLDGIYFNGHDYGNGKYPNFDYSTFCLMMQDPWGDFSDIRVIGNIHDNPELLGDVTCLE